MSQLHMVSEAEKQNNLLLCLCFHLEHWGMLWGAAGSAAVSPPLCCAPLPKMPRHSGVPVFGMMVWLEKEYCAWKTAIVYLNICVCMCGLHIAESKCGSVASPLQQVRPYDPKLPARFETCKCVCLVWQQITSCCPLDETGV